MPGKKSKEPTAQNEQKCTPSEVEKVKELIQKDGAAPWETGDIGFVFSPVINSVVPVGYLWADHKASSTGDIETVYTIESYDGRHDIDPKELHHHKLICWLVRLMDQWENTPDKASVEYTMELTRKTLEMSMDLKK